MTSNLVNIVSANYFDIGFGRYAAVMVPINIVSVIATLAVLWVVYARQIPTHYSIANLSAPKSAIEDALVFKAAFPILALLLVAYFSTESLGIPISFVTGVAALLLATALLLVLSEQVGATMKKRVSGVGWLDGLLIGCFQALAILPGISRSGATIAGGVIRGLERSAAARFSFLMAVPVMLGAGAVAGWDMLAQSYLVAKVAQRIRSKL